MNQLHLRIEKPAFGGYGLAFDNGKAVFVEKAVPGDVLSAEIYIQKKNYAIAKIESILSPSPERVEPQCSAFNECGGCAYLCVPYETEIKYKAAVIEDSLKHIAGISIPKMDIITGERFRYRSHAGIKTDGRSCGFFRKGSNILSPFPPDGCLLLSEKLLPLVRPRRDAKEFFIAFGALGTSGGIIKEEELGIVYEREMGNFFQANIFLRAAMLERAAAYACLSKKDSLPTGCRSAERAQDVQKTRSFLDIGCGVGF
ncbi:MAG: hypothetical protein LBT84_04235, partial [Spirochaetia bacterium]|nr:hypothetical protein [Spirochaetia bacterium]